MKSPRCLSSISRSDLTPFTIIPSCVAHTVVKALCLARCFQCLKPDKESNESPQQCQGESEGIGGTGTPFINLTQVSGGGGSVVMTFCFQPYLQMSGDSSDPSGQSFSPSQRHPLEMQVTWSLQTNCLGLQVLGAGGGGRT